jgi:hypothetical protein
MKTVKIRERKGEFQVYEKESGIIVFRGKTEDACFDFLANQREFSYQETEEEGVHYVY